MIDIVTYLRLPHLQIYNNSELSFEIFPVPQYPIFVAVDDKNKNFDNYYEFKLAITSYDSEFQVYIKFNLILNHHYEF